MTLDDPIWDDLFHACALEAFITVARAHGTWPLSGEVRRLAYAKYEAELKEKNATRTEKGITA